jgi:sugar O-acyltransferase (sialic acid O-acetyltransferase NeuD family)
MKYEIIGHCNNTLSIILEALYRMHWNSQGTSIDVIYQYEESCNVGDDNYLPPPKSGITIEEYIMNEWLPESNSKKIIAHMDSETRFSIYDYCLEEFELDIDDYGNIYHDRASIATTTKIGHGTYIDSGSVIAPYASIGCHNFINRNVSVGHHTIIRDFCSLNPGCNIGGDCIICKGTTVGIGATILDNIMIGDNCFIGAGSLVTRNVAPNSVVYGVPAKFIRAKK